MTGRIDSIDTSNAVVILTALAYGIGDLCLGQPFLWRWGTIRVAAPTYRNNSDDSRAAFHPGVVWSSTIKYRTLRRKLTALCNSKIH